MSARAEIGALVGSADEITAESWQEMHKGFDRGSHGEALPDDATGPFVVGWCAGAHGEGFISTEEANLIILSEKAEPNGDQVKG